MRQTAMLAAAAVMIATCSNLARAADEARRNNADRPSRKKKAGTGAAIKGTVKLCEFVGPITKLKVAFRLYLPPGYGALYCSTKYPELFSMAILIDGALHTFETTKKKYPNGAFLDIYNGDRAYYEKYSPWSFLHKNADTIRKDVAYVVLVGQLKEWNRALKQQLEALNIPFVYEETEFAHQGGKIMHSRRETIAAAFEKHLAK